MLRQVYKRSDLDLTSHVYFCRSSMSCNGQMDSDMWLISFLISSSLKCSPGLERDLFPDPRVAPLLFSGDVVVLFNHSGPVRNPLAG